MLKRQIQWEMRGAELGSNEITCNSITSFNYKSQ